jgi:hypothetical protein
VTGTSIGKPHAAIKTDHWKGASGTWMTRRFRFVLAGRPPAVTSMMSTAPVGLMFTVAADFRPGRCDHAKGIRAVTRCCSEWIDRQGQAQGGPALGTPYTIRLTSPDEIGLGGKYTIPIEIT